MINYGKLWKLLDERGMKKTDLKEVISSATLAKLGKNEPVSLTVIENICDFLNCQPGEIMQNVRKQDVEEVVKQFGDVGQGMVKQLKESNISEEEFMKMMNEAMKMMFNGGNPMEKVMEEAMKQSAEDNTEDANK